MSTKRRQHSSEFKAKVAISAIKNDFTTSQLCSRYQISPSCVFKWKKEVLEKISSLFDSPNPKKSEFANQDNEKLYAEIGKLKIAKDFLEKKLEGWIQEQESQ